jgi:hypothetical protein
MNDANAVPEIVTTVQTLSTNHSNTNRSSPRVKWHFCCSPFDKARTHNPVDHECVRNQVRRKKPCLRVAFSTLSV